MHDFAFWRAYHLCNVLIAECRARTCGCHPVQLMQCLHRQVKCSCIGRVLPHVLASSPAQALFGGVNDCTYNEDLVFDRCWYIYPIPWEPDPCADPVITWVDAIAGLRIYDGADAPESQTIALNAAINEWEWNELGFAKVTRMCRPE